MTYIKKPSVKALVEQTTSNATSWIGHPAFDNKEIAGGQTFFAASDGELEAIEVFASIVTTPGKVVMTVHSFDAEAKKWGAALGSATVDFNVSDTGKWKPFLIAGPRLSKGQSYGFKLEAAACYIGVGEAAAQTPPLANGQEWKFINKDQQGKAYSYFSLAFKVAVKA